MTNRRSKTIELYDPHPGFAGAAIPLPRAMKDLADELSGQKMMLEEVLEKMSQVSTELGGAILLKEEHRYIGFREV